LTKRGFKNKREKKERDKHGRRTRHWTEKKSTSSKAEKKDRTGHEKIKREKKEE